MALQGVCSHAQPRAAVFPAPVGSLGTVSDAQLQLSCCCVCRGVRQLFVCLHRVSPPPPPPLAAPLARPAGNGVFLLLLLNVVLFVADHVLHLKGIQGLYLNHARPQWYQVCGACDLRLRWFRGSTLCWGAACSRGSAYTPTPEPCARSLQRTLLMRVHSPSAVGHPRVLPRQL